MKSESSPTSPNQSSASATKLNKVYDHDFALTDEYHAALPDMQNTDSQQIFEPCMHPQGWDFELPSPA